MHPAKPPLLLKPQISLKVEKEVRRRHSSTREEISRHPAVVKVVWCTVMAEEMNEELAAGLQRRCNFGHEQFIVLHMFKDLHLNR